MKIRKDGIYRTIDSKDFGIFQKSGWEKVVDTPLPKLEEVAPKVEPIKEVIQDEPVEEIVDEMPKSKKNRRK